MIGPKISVYLSPATLTDNLSGGSSETWADVRTLTGSLMRNSGNETLTHQKTEVLSSHLFYLSYPIGVTITEKDKLRYGTRTFEIKYVENISEVNIATKLFLQEVV